MGLLINIVIADEDDIEAIGESAHPVEEWRGIEARDLDIPKFAMLHCLLTDDDFDEALRVYEPVYSTDYEGPMVLRFPEEATEKLALLEEDGLEQVAGELAASAEFETTGWPVEDVQGFVVLLADLARMAQAQGQVMLVWMHPLNT